MFAEVEHRLGEAVVVLQEVEVPQLHVQDEGRGGDLGVEHYTPVEAARAVLAAGTVSAPSTKHVSSHPDSTTTGECISNDEIITSLERRRSLVRVGLPEVSVSLLWLAAVHPQLRVQV